MNDKIIIILFDMDVIRLPALCFTQSNQRVQCTLHTRRRRLSTRSSPSFPNWIRSLVCLRFECVANAFVSFALRLASNDKMHSFNGNAERWMCFALCTGSFVLYYCRCYGNAKRWLSSDEMDDYDDDDEVILRNVNSCAVNSFMY